jgi:hypothetical protein
MSPTSISEFLKHRFRGADEASLRRVLNPHQLEIVRIGGPHLPSTRSSIGFLAKFPDDAWAPFEVGTTGKVVPRGHVLGGDPWKELLKGRILGTDGELAVGELYFEPAARFKDAITKVKEGDFLEIDPFGVTSKIESALCEASLFAFAQSKGFDVKRMPENMAMHLGTQKYYDFEITKGDKLYRVELKSLWGTNTQMARLIHTVSKDKGKGKNSAREDKQVWTTSSCRFKDQDIFAVGMWLRTGFITDFRFAVSCPKSDSEWGLPPVPKHPKHVTQNPVVLDSDSVEWSEDLDEICSRVDTLRAAGKM